MKMLLLPSNPTIQVYFTGLLGFSPDYTSGLHVGVHHAAPGHKLKAFVITEINGRPSSPIYFPEASDTTHFVIDVQNPNPLHTGIREHPRNGDDSYDHLLKFRDLHPGATTQPGVFTSEIRLNHGYLYSADTHDVEIGLLQDECRVTSTWRITFMVGANIYLQNSSDSRAVLTYGTAPPMQLNWQANTVYKVYIINLPPWGPMGPTSHFQYYYTAYPRIPYEQRHDVCASPSMSPFRHSDHAHEEDHMHKQIARDPINYQHPCIPIGI